MHELQEILNISKTLKDLKTKKTDPDKQHALTEQFTAKGLLKLSNIKTYEIDEY